MTFEDVLNDMQEIFIDELDDESIEINSETTAADVEEWDSLNHVILVVAIEKHFKIRFTAEEVRGYKNVGDMCSAIIQKRTSS